MPDNAFVIAAVTMDDPRATRRNVSHFCIAGIFTGALSRALTVIFALVGAVTGAVTGALAGRASESGLFRGAGLGAVAGAILSIEVLEASRAYWYSERSGSRHSSSMADFIEELLNGRLSQEQVDISDISYEELFGVSDDVDTRGSSGASLENLPSYRITDEKIKDSFGDDICCAICLQDLEQGETARSLPHCQHTFHMSCVDKWLIRHGSCPVCRQVI